MKLKPLGNKILVVPVKKENYITETNIELVDNSLATAEVVEFSDEFADVYKKGDVILYSSGSGISQQYNGKTHLWLNGNGAPNGEVWAIIDKK